MKGKISEGQIKAVLKLLFKTGICTCSLSQLLILGKQEM